VRHDPREHAGTRENLIGQLRREFQCFAARSHRFRVSRSASIPGASTEIGGGMATQPNPTSHSPGCSAQRAAATFAVSVAYTAEHARPSSRALSATACAGLCLHAERTDYHATGLCIQAPDV
jgi:hypothetical protein